MLVLSRTPGQRIFIGDDVIVSVETVHGGKVQLGIVAPPGVKVLREELRPRPESPRPAPGAAR